MHDALCSSSITKEWSWSLSYTVLYAKPSVSRNKDTPSGTWLQTLNLADFLFFFSPRHVCRVVNLVRQSVYETCLRLLFVKACSHFRLVYCIIISEFVTDWFDHSSSTLIHTASSGASITVHFGDVIHNSALQPASCDQLSRRQPRWLVHCSLGLQLYRVSLTKSQIPLRYLLRSWSATSFGPASNQLA